jgi:lysophospholipase L1-like esterase
MNLFMKRVTMNHYDTSNQSNTNTSVCLRIVDRSCRLAIVLAVSVLVCRTASTCAQEAAPPDRNEVNTRMAPGNMMADSPVTFPATGALPCKYAPDVRTQSVPTEQGYYLFSSPCRSLSQIEKIQAEMPDGEFTAPPNDWTCLKKTRRTLVEGGQLHLLALGDSIVNDTMRSGWVAKLQEAYPKADIVATVYVRGGGGCQHYKEEGRIAENVVPRKPDLVLIGGISQQDCQSIQKVIHQLRANLPEIEIILATGTFGTTDPRDPKALANARHSGTSEYGRSLKKLAAEQRCAYLDMTTPWAQYIRSTKLHPHRFYRDRVHANEQGEQILSKTLTAFFSNAACL